jgi:hypothetical protein
VQQPSQPEVAGIYDGADEVHSEVVAKRLLREYGMGGA